LFVRSIAALVASGFEYPRPAHFQPGLPIHDRGRGECRSIERALDLERVTDGDVRHLESPSGLAWPPVVGAVKLPIFAFVVHRVGGRSVRASRVIGRSIDRGDWCRSRHSKSGLPHFRHRVAGGLWFVSAFPTHPADRSVRDLDCRHAGSAQGALDSE